MKETKNVFRLYTFRLSWNNNQNLRLLILYHKELILFISYKIKALWYKILSPRKILSNLDNEISVKMNTIYSNVRSVVLVIVYITMWSQRKRGIITKTTILIKLAKLLKFKVYQSRQIIITLVYSYRYLLNE